MMQPGRMARRGVLAAPLATLAAPARAQGAAVRLAFLGDVMLGRDVSAALANRSPDWFWGDVLPLLQGADAAIANLESPLTRAPLRQSRTPKWHHFRADPASVAILRAARVRAVNIANNHILDHGEQGLAETLAVLGEVHIVPVGAGMDAAAAAAPAMLDLPALRVGLLGATDALGAYAAGPGRPGNHQVAFRADSPAPAGPRRGRRRAEVLRGGGGRPLHWGPNCRLQPFDHARGFAHAALAAGFDVIHGHSAHLLHGVEAAPRGLVLYDTGNILDDYTQVPLLPQQHGCVFLLDLVQRRPARLLLVPVATHPWPLRVARGQERERILGRLRAASARLGTTLRPVPEGREAVLGDTAG